MRAAFRTGPLVADPDLLESVPRTALIAAIVRHATSLSIPREPIVTHHEHKATRFQIETDAERQRTVIALY